MLSVRPRKPYLELTGIEHSFRLVHILLHLPLLDLIGPLEHDLGFLILIHPLPVIGEDSVLRELRLAGLSVLGVEIVLGVVRNMRQLRLLSVVLIQSISGVLLAHLHITKAQISYEFLVGALLSHLLDVSSPVVLVLEGALHLVDREGLLIVEAGGQGEGWGGTRCRPFPSLP